ncbi:MAG: hypothetical protein MJB14_13105 [Spirochaetes bacterium]|nr:hypothetical protein [Spirochaetota bacterium]
MNTVKDAKPFQNYIDDMAMEHISGFLYGTKGLFLPSTFTILYNFDFDEIKNEALNLPKAAIDDFNIQKNPLFFSTRFHEILHLVHIAGSSIGTIFLLARINQELLIDQFIKEVSNIEDFNYQLFCQNKNYYKIYTKQLNEWESWERIKCLFGSSYCNKGHAPRFKDYSYAIFDIVENFIGYNNYHNIQEINSVEYLKNMSMKLVGYGDSYVDCFIPLPPSDSIKAYNFNPEAGCLVTPPITIIEGYARWLEVINFLKHFGIENLIASLAFKEDEQNPRKYFLTL